MIRIASLARPLALLALGICLGLPPAAAESSVKDTSVKDVLKTYADIAAAGYADSLATAKNLQLAVNQLLDHPTDENMLAARAAWVAARIPYMQTEAYRFGNKIVDDWEGKVNSWPLDEGLID
jgi:putative iron-regulated protein